MTMDLRDRLEMTRHVRGCALFALTGKLIGSLGADAEAVETAGRGLIAFLKIAGTVGEPSLAAVIPLEEGELFVRSCLGDLLVVKTDGGFEMTEPCFEALVDALLPHEQRGTHESGIRLRESGIVPRTSAPARRIG